MIFLAFNRGLLYNNLGDFMTDYLKQSGKIFFVLLFAVFASNMLVLSFSILTNSETKWLFYFLSQTFSFVLLILLLYGKMYSLGFKDSNRVNSGIIAKNLFKGFIIGFIAQIPSFIFSIVCIFLNTKFAWYLVFNAQYYSVLKAISGGVTNMQISPIRIILIFLLFLIVPVITGVAYVLGYKGIDLMEKFVYKKHKVD